MKRFIHLIALGAALSAFPALAEGRGSDREPSPATRVTADGERRDCDHSGCCARHVTVQPDEVSIEQREREGWGGAG